ncbi:HNH endonuclease [Sphingopyxis sp. 113P3]|uniref:HNH endonuclease n=1 Tax=Sphingopyxis sp. (strain 113P3) TaxID=292913 RepID=UPI0006BCE1BA|nr:phosphatidylinositol-bisphosphatase [Sphingopyxis sp. 113P3]
MANARLCTIRECGKRLYCRGLCESHYWKLRTYGDPLHVARPKREVIIEGDSAIVPLTRGYRAIIDAEDVHLVEGNCWSVVIGNTGICYAKRTTNADGLILMHRMILNAPVGAIVDHKNGNGLDNRKANLRIATLKQNAQNRRKRRGTAGALKGACWDADRNTWVSGIYIEGRKVHLGSFETEQGAHEAYCRAATDAFGEFARFS